MWFERRGYGYEVASGPHSIRRPMEGAGSMENRECLNLLARVASFRRNGRLSSTGTGGIFQPEYASGCLARSARHLARSFLLDLERNPHGVRSTDMRPNGAPMLVRVPPGDTCISARGPPHLRGEIGESPVNNHGVPRRIGANRPRRAPILVSFRSSTARTMRTGQ